MDVGEKGNITQNQAEIKNNRKSSGKMKKTTSRD